MNKIITGLLMIGLIAGMAGAGTWAYFSDTETSTGNTYTSGIIDISLLPGTSQVVTATAGDTQFGPGCGANPETTDKLKPCYVGKLKYTVANDGDNKAKIFMNFDNIVDTDLDTSEPEGVEETKLGGKVNDISKKIYIDLKVGNKVLIPDGVVTLDQLKGKLLGIGILKPGQSVEVWISFHLKPEAGNEYQSDKSTFDVEFNAYQLGPGIILPKPKATSEFSSIVDNEETEIS
ncbi:MAG TPA: TasA family protein [Candidatus Methylomirabilis sp.]|nr:TasA family protein [Candidatus Methylomirabilis sp.]